MRFTKLIPIVFGGLLILGIYGCNTPESDPTTAPSTPNSELLEEHADDDHADHNHDAQTVADNDSPMAKMMPGLKELSPEDYESAMEQHLCPVSGEMLGTMGAPEKVNINGKSVWICCDGCKDKLLAEPDKYLSK